MNTHLASSEKLAGQVIVAGFEGTVLPAALADAIRCGGLGGIILFKRNIEELRQVAALLEEAHGIAPENRPLIAAVDQEGGRVVRLGEPLTALPPARRLGEVDDPELTERVGALVGMELNALGFTVNFAPVLDVDTNPASPIIGDRAYGATPEQVVRHALPFAQGLARGGIVPCAKHFPGHGDAALDSHHALPRVTCDRVRLERVEMAPFAAWCRAALGPVMSAHVVYPALDPAHPATLSHTIIDGELRHRLGFGGVVFSDDLEMGAIKALGGAGQVAVRAMAAGIDGLLVCRLESSREAVQDALTKRATDDASFRQRLAVAADRLAALPFFDPPRDLSWIESAAHRALQVEILNRLRNEVA